MSHQHYGYAFIKQLAKERGCNVPDLLALASKNDPFYVGGRTSRVMADWFAALWERFQFPRGVHLRRIHYQLATSGDVLKPDGLPYRNSDKDWEYLEETSKYARHLRLVDPTAFVDRRNPEPHIFCHSGPLPETLWTSHFPEWELPRIHAGLSYDVDWELPTFAVDGYDYHEALQPFHVEVWVEKSTMDDVLLPLCRQFGVNYVKGIGFMTITSVLSLLQRIMESQKPGRILYISDFDPAGYAMPSSVARHIEFQLHTGGIDHDVKLMPIALTREQIDRYALPRIPVKNEDCRKANFEEQHGEGAVELDALEALHPGSLTALVQEQILHYRDPELHKKVHATFLRARDNLRAAWEARIGLYEERLAALKEQVKQIVGQYQPQLETLQEEMTAELAAVHGEMDSLRLAVENETAAMEVSLPVLPAPEVEPDQADWLFDSRRNYLEQMQVYKRRKTKPGND